MDLKFIQPKQSVFLVTIGLLFSLLTRAQIESYNSLEVWNIREVKVYKMDNEKVEGYILEVSDSSISILTLSNDGFSILYKAPEIDTLTINATKIDYIRLKPSLKQNLLGISIASPLMFFSSYLGANYFGPMGATFGEAIGKGLAGGLLTGFAVGVVAYTIIWCAQNKRFYIEGEMENFQLYNAKLKEFELYKETSE